MVATVLVACALPMALRLAGFDLGIDPPPELVPGTELTLDVLHRQLRGGFLHTLLEWSGVLAAFFTALLSLVHYRLERDPVTPVIGIALFCAGWMDLFHILAADRLLASAGPSEDFVPFTWALARTFHALVLLVGPTVFYLWSKGRSRTAKRLLLWVGLGLLILSSIVIFLSATTTTVPRSFFPDHPLRRPWDIVPLGLFALAGGLVYPSFHRRYGSVFTHALLISTVPAVISQLHMAFGNAALYDHDFSAAHLLKLLSYLVPFAGLTMDYFDTLAIVHRQSRELGLIQDALGSLERREDTILQTTADGVVGLDRAGRFTFANPAAARMLQRTPRELAQCFLVDIVDPMEPGVRGRLQGALVSGEALDVEEAPLGREDGSWFPAGLTFTPVIEDGRPSGAVVTFRDITGRKKRESEIRDQSERLWRMNRQLSRSNEDLEQFAYVASHDLKAPLRAVASLATWIEEDLGDHTNDEVQDHIRLLKSRVRRMERLLADLLHFARAGRADPRIRRIDVTELVRGVAQLQAPPEGFEVVPVGVMPVFDTATTPLEHVLMNLVGNAINHHDRATGRIEVCCEEAGPWMRFSVSDDGPGIPADYHEQVFRVLTTLKPRDTREASGMGLAIVKKLVEGAGGTVSIEPNQPRGTTFVFTWPRRWGEVGSA